MLSKIMLAGVVLGASLLFGGASTARADNWRSCEERIEQEQHDLDRAIARHGYYSRQANHERRELNRLYRECSYRHRDRDHDRDYYR
jgi:outer membrane murein-binding lipoprotein Lpp